MTDTPVEAAAARKLTGPALVAALIALVFWLVFVGIMIARADTANDTYWARLAFLLASVEAVAFAAGGALWGSSIQRERAEKAEATAAQHAEDAANGRALASAIVADDASDTTPSDGREQLGAGGASNDAARRHAELARRLFPDA